MQVKTSLSHFEIDPSICRTVSCYLAFVLDSAYPVPWDRRFDQADETVCDDETPLPAHSVTLRDCAPDASWQTHGPIVLFMPCGNVRS